MYLFKRFNSEHITNLFTGRISTESYGVWSHDPHVDGFSRWQGGAYLRGNLSNLYHYLCYSKLNIFPIYNFYQYIIQHPVYSDIKFLVSDR